MTALDAAGLLQRELPGSTLHLNRIYRIYYPAANDGEKGGSNIEPADPDVPCIDDRCYGRQAIKWKDDLGKCASKRKIGIIDTHVDVGHKALAGQNIRQKTFMPHGREPAKSGHGTGVLAILAGRPDSGTPGLIPEADFLVASIFFTGGDGGVQTDTVSLLKALQWMDRSDVKLVNMSFSGPQDPLLERRIGRLRAEGMVFTAAAGNEGLAAGPSYPAAYPDVVAVTAVDKKMRIYPSANRGDYIDLAAPGVHIWTALPKSKAGYMSGTSFAAPFVTAMLAIQRPETLRLPTDDLLDQVRTVTPEAGARSQTYGRGLLQAPGECPGAPAIATGWTPVTEVSLR
jgi:subtilisin family serine protease